MRAGELGDAGEQARLQRPVGGEQRVPVRRQAEHVGGQREQRMLARAHVRERRARRGRVVRDARGRAGQHVLSEAAAPEQRTHRGELVGLGPVRRPADGDLVVGERVHEVRVGPGDQLEARDRLQRLHRRAGQHRRAGRSGRAHERPVGVDDREVPVVDGLDVLDAGTHVTTGHLDERDRLLRTGRRGVRRGHRVAHPATGGASPFSIGARTRLPHSVHDPS